jgi:DNA-binding MarR family transcriptional regulator
MPEQEQWEATLDRILELTALLARDTHEYLTRVGLTEARAHLVWELGRRGPCKQQALAEAVGVTPRTITALVDGLVATGFVTREAHPTDRRATQVTLTANGQATAQALLDGHQTLARQLFAELPAERFEQFDAVLSETIARLRGVIGRPARGARPPDGD